MAITVEARNDLISIVVGMFNAAPGVSVLSDLTVAREAGQTRLQIATNLAKSAEYLSIYPELMTNAEFATALVNNMVGNLVSATAKSDAVAMLTGILNSKNTSTPASKALARAEVTLTALDALKAVPATDATFGAASAALTNKVEVASHYSVVAKLNPTSVSNAQSILQNVDSSAASVTSAKATIDGSVNAGQTFSLTASSETKTGTAGNDTFLALNNGDLGNGDIIDGGAGTGDTLYTVINTGDGTAVSLGRPVLSNIETLEVELVEVAAGNQAGDTNILNLDKSSGINSVVVKNYTFATNADTNTISGVTTATTLTITDDNGAANTRANNFTMSYSGVSGTADSAAVHIKSTVAATALGNVTVAGVETLTVSSSGGAGAGYNVVAADATALTLDASASSGGSIDLNAPKVATLNINAADSVTVTDAGGAAAKLRTVNVDSQTASKTVTLTTLTPTATAATNDTFTVNVKGAGKASISVDTNWGAQGTTNADSFVVNAGGNAGGVTVDLSAFTTNAPQNMHVHGGTGSDTVTVATGGLDKNDIIALGDGTADALVTAATFGNAGSTISNLFYTDTLTGADLPAISGVETARINLAGVVAGTHVFSAKSAAFASNIEVNSAAALDIGNNSFSVSNLAAGQSVMLGSNLDLDSAVVTLSLADATGTADSLAIKTDGFNQTATATFGGLTAAGVETVSVDLASTATANTTVAAGTLTFADATTVTLTGSKTTSATVDAKDGATIDATAMTGTVDLTVATADKYTVKGSATKATKFIMSTGLNASDTIVGGAATTDSLTATINGLTATTGALNISGVETIELTTSTAASTVSAAGVTGASKIAVGADQSVTLTNLAAGVKLQLGTAADATYDGAKTLTASLADATGTADAITVDLIERAGDGGIAANLSIAGVETVTINDLAAAGTNDDASLAVASVAATKLILSGSYSTEALNLTTDGATANQTLNAATNHVDASAFKGVLTVAAATNTGTTFVTRGAVGTLTGSAASDTITIGSSANYIDASVGTVDAGAGTDVVNVYLGGSNASLDGVTNAETININLGAVAGFAFNAGGGNDATITATTVNYLGGKAGETYTATATLTDVAGRLIDASGLLGSLKLTFGDDALIQTNVADLITIRGGQGSADMVTVSQSNSNTGEFTMSGVETLVFGNDTGASTLDLKNVTGLTTLVVTDDGAGGGAANVAVNNALSGLTLQIGDATNDFASATVDVNLATATGSADSITIDLVNTATALTVDTAGIETVNIRAKAAAANSATDVITIAGTVTGGTINVSGTDADDEVTLAGIASGYTTVNATGLKGDLTIAASARGSDAMTITGGDGGDSIAMENKDDVLTGGAGTDTLVVSVSGTGGALIVDLSATDQVQMVNGLANAAAQSGFENVDASNYVQTNSVGADITGSTGANTIIGTAYADTIRAGDGNDIVDSSGGADQIYVGAGSDTVDLDAADTTTGAVTLGTTNISSTADIVYGMGDGDKIDLGLTMTAAAGVALGTAVIDAADANAGGADQVTLIRGTYSNGVFTAGTNAGDDDYLVQGNDHSANDVVFSAVLIDVVGTVTYDISVAGVMELNVV